MYGEFNDPPVSAWIHNISKNQLKYVKSRISEYDLGHDVRYVMYIHDNPNISQNNLVEVFGQSKGNVAKILRKLEEKNYIEREVNPENRRKYMLRTTQKGDELVPKFRKISRDWEREIGIDNDIELKRKLKEIAFRSMEIID